MTTRRTLIVVGAALGSGRWLAEHVMTKSPWDRVILIDSDRSRSDVRDLRWSFACGMTFGRSVETPEGTRFEFESGVVDLLDVDRDEITVCIAVPPEALAGVAKALHEAVPHPTAIIVSVVGMVGSLRTVIETGWDARIVTGVHALNDSAAPSAFGQIIYLVPGAGSNPDERIVGLVEAAGAVTKVGSADEHDRTMAVVQALTHRHLVAFADAVGESGLAIEDTLWPARTPLFEALLGLAVRVLEPRQQAMVSVIQEAFAAPQHASAIETAMRRVPSQNPTRDLTGEWIQDIRGRFSGTFFDGVRSVASQTIESIQRVRAELAEHRAVGGLVGLSRSGASPRIHVGRIVELTSTTVEIEEFLVGAQGHAALLVGPGAENAARIGVTTKAKRSELALGNVSVLSPVELEAVLDAWLARISRDIRLLVPESISGAGVLQAVSALGDVSDAVLVDEVVRTGQRSVVVRVGIRADRSLDAAIERIRDHVDSVYRWPLGVSRRIGTRSAHRVVYLGPAGTFSETAATQLASSLDLDAAIEDAPGFEEVLAAVTQGALGVIPLSSSASGLVTRAVRTLLTSPPSTVAGGVIDVAVRFDAYASNEYTRDELIGSPVYSHPQALAQCQGFIRRMRLQPVATASTATALDEVSASAGPAIALAGVEKSMGGRLRTLEREVDDLSGSITRFLVIGTDGAFRDAEPGSAPTLRAVWIGDAVSEALPLLSAGGAGFDELLTDADGNFALISSRAPGAIERGGSMRFLGNVPWSPRTPIVRPRAAD